MAAKKRGAPKKKNADVKSERIPVRVTKAQKKSIEQEAEKAGLSASAYLIALHGSATGG